MAACFGGRILSQWSHTHKVPSSSLPVSTYPVALFLFILFLFHGFMLLCICFIIWLHSPPQYLAPSLTHHTYKHFCPFPLLLQCMFPPYNHTRIPCFIPLAPLFPFPCLPNSSHIPHSHNHSIYNTIQSFPFTGTHNTAPFSSLSPSTPTSHSLH